MSDGRSLKGISNTVFVVGLVVAIFTSALISGIVVTQFGLQGPKGDKGDTGPATFAATYTIETDGSGNYRATKYDGSISWDSTNASYTIDSAINAMTTGGKIHLSIGTFTLTAPILFGQGSGVSGYRYSWILEGEGILSTTLSVATAGVSAIIVKNETEVGLRDFRLNMGSSAGYGIWGDGSGTGSPVSFRNSEIRNILIESGNPNYAQMRLENPSYVYGADIGLASGIDYQNNCEIICTNTSTSNYGNSEFDALHCYNNKGIGLLLNGCRYDSSDHIMNMITFNNLNIFSYDNGVDGIRIGYLVSCNTFVNPDIEGFTDCVHIDGISSREPTNNVFYSGYLQSPTNAINCGTKSHSNVFRDIRTYGKVIDSSTYFGNIFQDLSMGSGTFTKGTYTVCTGKASPTTFFSNTASVTVGAGVSQYNITHTLIASPTTVLLTTSWATTISYVGSSTWLNVTFGTTTGGTLTWYTGI